jgi:hypothetical protein
MVASRRYRRLVGVLLAWAAASWAAISPFELARAGDVYFPATTAYNRHNYDPFDQAKAASFAAQAADADSGHNADGDIKLSSGIRLAAAERFVHSVPAPQEVIPAALQAVSPATPEPLPAPPAVPRANVGEPGADWTSTPLTDLTTNIAIPGGVLPRNYWSERAPQHVEFFDPCGQTRGWPVTTYDWVASCFCCNPLYFEEVNLERYGYGCGCCGPCCTTCVESAVSGAHFFANVVALPYKMGVDCPCDCDYTLGHYRPGSCPPWRWTCCSRCSALGGLSAGGVATGLIFLIP